jgi:hydrogenase maturation protein HypF
VGDTAERGYAFALVAEDGRIVLDGAPLWPALLDDLAHRVPRAVVAARFHLGLTQAIVDVVDALRDRRFDTVALSGGVFQNRVLLERVSAGLRARGLVVLAHRLVPANDGGLALGQAAIAAARLLVAQTDREVELCV